MLQKKKITLFFFIVLILAFFASFLPVKIPYKVKSKALLKPILVWELARTNQGNLVSKTLNNFTGIVESYSISEFSRGDAVNFILSDKLKNGTYVHKGDTIGVLYSNEQQSKMVDLQGALSILKAELEFFSTGVKPEDVRFIEEQLSLAKQELETQNILSSRAKALLADSVIAQQEFDIVFNELKIKELAVSIAEAQLSSVTTGDKPEQIKLIEARILATEKQLNQVIERLEYFTLKSPVIGEVIISNSFIESDVMLQIIDNSEYIGIAPIPSELKSLIPLNSKVCVLNGFSRQTIHGVLASFDNVSQMLQGRTVVYSTILFNDGNSHFKMGDLIEVEFIGDEMQIHEYLKTVLKTPL